MLERLGFLNFLIERDIWWVFPCAFLVGIAAFSLLIVACHTRIQFVRNIFYIPARKSITNAVQLGGLPLSLTLMLGYSQIFTHENFSSFFSQLDHYSFKYWFLSASVIIAYGYFDDRFELRPIVKLSLQIICIGLFSLLESRVLFPKWSALAFIVLSIAGLGVLNGANLLDGLDTLTIKLGSVSFLSYFVIAYNYKISSVVIASLMALSVLGAFYLFNKEPAKIHLGEIGGSFVGFTCLLVSCLSYTGLIYHRIDHVNALATAVMPLTLPMVELGISFLRRIYNRKSPFSGDKLHIHHILKNYHNLSPSNASSVFALGYGTTMVIGFCIGHYFGPIIGTISSLISLVAAYIMVGKSHWKGQDTMDLKPTALFDFLLKKDVSVISSLEVDDFTIEIIGKETEEDESVFAQFEEDNDPSEEEKPNKKAA